MFLELNVYVDVLVKEIRIRNVLFFYVKYIWLVIFWDKFIVSLNLV